MITKYRCKEHGMFPVEVPALGGRGHHGCASPTRPCPTCGAEVSRAYGKVHHISVTEATYRRLKAYCATSGATIAGLVRRLTGDDAELVEVVNRIRQTGQP